MTRASIRRRLWGVGTARTFRPHWMLAELGLEYETREIVTRTSNMEDPDFTTLSKRGKIPLYEDGDLMIGESAAIVLFLAERYRNPEQSFLPPAGTNERARHDELCFFIMTEMDALLYTIRRHGGLPEIYGESLVAVEAAREYFLRSAEEIERRLGSDHHFLLGDTFSVADLLLKTCLDWAGFVQLLIPESLRAYSSSLGERPAYQIAMAKNFTPASVAALVGTPQ